MRVRRIGVITSGGDAPGMNPAVRAVVRAADAARIESFGITSGYDGLIKGNLRPLGPRDVGDISHRGGTILRTARCPEMLEEEGRARARHNLAAEGIDALVVIGGDGSLRAAHLLDKEGMPAVGVPASIDNDLWGTTMAIGVDTALNTIVDAVDRLRDTAQSHQRVFLVETMGRNSGYLALLSGIACGAEMAIIPERATTLEDVAAAVNQAYSRGKNHAFIMVAEGAGLGIHEVADFCATSSSGLEPRVTLLGHVQRGGSPSSFDRILASRLGAAAVGALVEGEHDVMMALTGTHIERLPLVDVTERRRDTDLSYVDLIAELAR
jgi:6-phosphofructokinase 1